MEIGHAFLDEWIFQNSQFRMSHSGSSNSLF